MKKIILILSLLYAHSCLFAQSLELTPNTSLLKSASTNQIILMTNQVPSISGIRVQNTLASPQTLTSGSNLLTVGGKGYNGSTVTGDRVGMLFTATQAWNGSANGTDISFFTTPNNSVSPGIRMKIAHDGKVGIGTGSPAYPLDVAGRINTNAGFSINGVPLATGYYYYASPWMNSPTASVDSTIDGTCLRTRRLPIPQLTSDMFGNALVTVYFRVGSIGPYQLPYISDAGGVTNQIHWFMKKAGEIIVYRHTLNSCRFSSGDPESYAGEPIMINIPQSLEYRVVITRP